jgi:hypothetical protein
VVLDEIELDGDLVNKVLEVTLETADADDVLIDRYSLPVDEEE